MSYAEQEELSASPVSRSFLVTYREIIVFKFPKDETKVFVKRIIGILGDIVEIRNKQVILNGIPVDDLSYTQLIDQGILDRSVNPQDTFGPVTVPEASYFVLGDNRDQSLDN